jgi:hypothetical protein
MKSPRCSLAVLLVWASAVHPALAQRAYNAYDRPLLGLVAAEELRAMARHAADDPRLQIEAFERHDRRGQRHVVDLLGAMRRGRPGG